MPPQTLASNRQFGFEARTEPVKVSSCRASRNEALFLGRARTRHPGAIAGHEYAWHGRFPVGAHVDYQVTAGGIEPMAASQSARHFIRRNKTVADANRIDIELAFRSWQGMARRIETRD